MRCCLTAVVAWLAAASLVSNSLVAADDELLFDIRGPEAPQGMTIRSVSTWKATATVTVKRDGMLVIVEKPEVTATSEEELRVEEVDGGGVTRFTTRVIADEKITTFPDDDKRPKETKNGPLAGQTVVSKRTGTAWTHGLDEDTPTAEQQAELATKSGWDEERTETPAGRQPIGKTWQIDKNRIKKHFQDAKVGAGEIQATFAGIKLVGGELCAIVESEGSLQVEMKIGKDQTLPTTLAVKFTEYRSLKHGVAVQAEGTFRFTGSTSETTDGTTIEIAMDIDATFEIRSEVKK